MPLAVRFHSFTPKSSHCTRPMFQRLGYPAQFAPIRQEPTVGSATSQGRVPAGDKGEGRGGICGQ
jgi:hypothetical protein